MKATDLYYMLNDDGYGFFLVTKDFWKEKMCIDDNELTAQYPEIFDFLPQWKDDKSKGFSEIAEGQFEYNEGLRRKTKKGIQILKSLGIQQIIWGQKNPVKEEVVNGITVKIRRNLY